MWWQACVAYEPPQGNRVWGHLRALFTGRRGADRRRDARRYDAAILQNHIDTPPSPAQKRVRRNIMSGSGSGNVMTLRWVREGAYAAPGGTMLFIGPIRDAP